MEGLTVAQALQLPEMQGIDVVSGNRGLQNNIQSVTVLEVPRDYDRWLQGNELCLTTLYNFLEHGEDPVALIKELAKSQVAALALHPGIMSRKLITEEMMAAADEEDLPLLRMPREMPYISIFVCIFTELLHRKASILDKSHHINMVLTSRVLQGCGVQETLRTLRGLLDRPVVLLNPDFRVLEKCELASDDWSFFPSSLVERLQRKGLSPDREEEGTVLCCDGSGRECLLIPVQGEKRLYGYLATCGHSEHPLQQLDRFALRHAMTVVGFNYLKEEAVQKTRKEISSGLMEDLLYNNYDQVESIHHRAEQLGLKLTNKRMVMVVDIDNFEDYYLNNVDKGEEGIQQIKNRMYRMVREEMEVSFPRTIILSESDSLILFPQFDQSLDREERRTQLIGLMERIRDRNSRELPQISLSFGLGGFKERLEDLSKSFEEARIALRFSSLVNPHQSYAFYDQLGIYRLLSGYLERDTEELEEYCQEHLAPLLAYDREHSASLVKTLEEYLDCGESPAQTAERLYLHPNTVKYRMGRIMEILDYDPLSHPEERLALHLALKLHKVMQAENNT